MTPEELSALEAIKQLKARYCRLVDTKDWDGYAALFAENASLKVYGVAPASGGDPELIAESRSAAEIRRNVEQINDAMTVHHCHAPEITLTSQTCAQGIWAMEDIVAYPGRRYHGFGHYHETYVLHEGDWKIASLRLTRLLVEMREDGRARPPGSTSEVTLSRT